MEATVAQGDVWNLDFNPVRGHEQGGFRPALVLSRNAFNDTGLELIVVVAISTMPFIPEFQIALDPPEGGLRERSYIFAHQIRTVSTDRLVTRRGEVRPETLQAVLDIAIPIISMPKRFG